MDPSARTRLSRTTPDPLVGKSFDGYRIEDLVGRGGMGAVYKAKQISLGRPVAIKVLPESDAGDPQYLERFHREADALSRLSHPGVVTVFDRGEVDGRPYLVMEFVDGTSLREVLRSGPLPPAEALVIVRSILSALEHAHDQGIVHRDIKPENVLLAAGGVVKVADFGLSRMVAPDEATRLTRTHVVLGTYEYMAPEQREFARDADERSDLYATGVVLYEMIAGELPIGHFAPLSRKRPGECDRRIDEVVAKALTKDPAARYQAATQMADAVSAILDRESESVAANLPSALRAAMSAPMDPLRFATRLDILATITTLLGFAIFIGAFAWLMAVTVGEAFVSSRSQTNSFAYAVPCLGICMLGWYFLETAGSLRRYRPGSRQAQGILSMLAAPTGILLPYSVYAWWVLHTFRGRAYYDARSRGLDAQQAMSSIAEVALSNPDAPLSGPRHGKAPPPPPSSFWGRLWPWVAATALAGAWSLGFSWFSGHHLHMEEWGMMWLAMAGSYWLVAAMPRVFRGGDRGPIYAFAGIVIFVAVAIVGTGAVMAKLHYDW